MACFKVRFIGGPHDGLERDFPTVPQDEDERTIYSPGNGGATVYLYRYRQSKQAWIFVRQWRQERVKANGETS